FPLTSIRRHPRSTLFPYTTLFRSERSQRERSESIARDLELVGADREQEQTQHQPAVERSGDEAAKKPRGRRQRKNAQQLQPEVRSEEHTSELQSRSDLVCRLLLEK